MIVELVSTIDCGSSGRQCQCKCDREGDWRDSQEAESTMDYQAKQSESAQILAPVDDSLGGESSIRSTHDEDVNRSDQEAVADGVMAGHASKKSIDEVAHSEHTHHSADAPILTDDKRPEVDEKEGQECETTAKRGALNVSPSTRKAWLKEAMKQFVDIKTNEYYYCHPPSPLRKDEIQECICSPPFDPEGNEYDRRCEDVNCLNYATYVECIEGYCPAGTYCCNRRLQNRQYADIFPFKTEKTGWGILAGEDIREETLISEYVGQVIKEKEFVARLRETEGSMNFYFLMLKPGLYIDARQKGNISRFLNHSCQPNCKTEKWQVGPETRIGIFALRDIKKGEELTFDYQWQRVGAAEKIRCLCGSSTCRGFLDTGEDLLEVGDTSSSDADGDDLDAGHGTRSRVRPGGRREQSRGGQVSRKATSNWNKSRDAYTFTRPGSGTWKKVALSHERSYGGADRSTDNCSNDDPTHSSGPPDEPSSSSQDPHRVEQTDSITCQSMIGRVIRLYHGGDRTYYEARVRSYLGEGAQFAVEYADQELNGRDGTVDVDLSTEIWQLFMEKRGNAGDDSHTYQIPKRVVASKEGKIPRSPDAMGTPYATLNSATFHNATRLGQPSPLFVSPTRSGKSNVVPNTSNILRISNVGPSTTGEQLRLLISRFGFVASFYFIDGVERKALVAMGDKPGAEAARSALNNRMLKDRRLKVHFAPEEDLEAAKHDQHAIAVEAEKDDEDVTLGGRSIPGESTGSSSHINRIMGRKFRWILPPAVITTESPSRKDGMSLALEETQKKMCFRIICQTGKILKLDRAIACRALQLILRLFAATSARNINIQATAAAALVVAAKATSLRKDLRTLLQASYQASFGSARGNARQAKGSSRKSKEKDHFLLDPASPQYESWLRKVLNVEQRMVNALNLDLSYEDPFEELSSFKSLSSEMQIPDQTLREARRIILESHCYSVWLRHESVHLVYAALLQASAVSVIISLQRRWRDASVLEQALSRFVASNEMRMSNQDPGFAPPFGFSRAIPHDLNRGSSHLTNTAPSHVQRAGHIHSPSLHAPNVYGGGQMPATEAVRRESASMPSSDAEESLLKHLSLPDYLFKPLPSSYELDCLEEACQSLGQYYSQIRSTFAGRPKEQIVKLLQRKWCLEARDALRTSGSPPSMSSPSLFAHIPVEEGAPAKLEAPLDTLRLQRSNYTQLKEVGTGIFWTELVIEDRQLREVVFESVSKGFYSNEDGEQVRWQKEHERGFLSSSKVKVLAQSWPLKEGKKSMKGFSSAALLELAIYHKLHQRARRRYIIEPLAALPPKPEHDGGMLATAKQVSISLNGGGKDQQDGQGGLLFFPEPRHSLAGLLGSKLEFSREAIRLIAWDLLCAVRHCHELGVVHRNISASKVFMYGNGDVCLGGFTSARFGAQTFKEALEVSILDKKDKEKDAKRRDAKHRSKEKEKDRRLKKHRREQFQSEQKNRGERPLKRKREESREGGEVAEDGSEEDCSTGRGSALNCKKAHESERGSNLTDSMKLKNHGASDVPDASPSAKRHHSSNGTAPSSDRSSSKNSGPRSKEHHHRSQTEKLRENRRDRPGEAEEMSKEKLKQLQAAFQTAVRGVGLETAPPEVLLGLKEGCAPGDMWAVGTIIARLLLRRGIFHSRTVEEQLQEIYKNCGAPTGCGWHDGTQLPYYPFAKPSKKYPPRLAQRLKDKAPQLDQVDIDFVTALLILDPSKRMSAEQALRHPFFSVFHLRDREGTAESPSAIARERRELGEFLRSVPAALQRPKHSYHGESRGRIDKSDRSSTVSSLSGILRGQ